VLRVSLNSQIRIWQVSVSQSVFPSLDAFVSLYSFYPMFHALRWLEKTLACADLTSFYSQVRIHSKKLHVADQKQSLKASKTALNP
jgi:hypothetical protein